MQLIGSYGCLTVVGGLVQWGGLSNINQVTGAPVYTCSATTGTFQTYIAGMNDEACGGCKG